MKRIFLLLASLAAGFYVAQNIGIGTITPTATLHVKSEITGEKILAVTDGTQADQYVMFAEDNLGNGNWKLLSATGKSIVVGTLSPSGITMICDANASVKNWQNTGSFIELPPGRWAVNATLGLQSNIDPGSGNTAATYYIKNTLSDGPSTVAPSADIEVRNATGVRIVSGDALSTYISGTLYAPLRYGIARGSIIIDNQSTLPKKYYVVANFFRQNTNIVATISNYGSSITRENILYALPLTNIK